MAGRASPATSTSPMRLKSIRRPAHCGFTARPAALPSRPIHTSVDQSGGYLLTAYNNPSGVTVHRLNADGTIGAPVDAARRSRYRHLRASNPGGAGKPRRRFGDARQQCRRRQSRRIPARSRRSRSATALLRNLASIAPGEGLARGIWFRAAPSRLPSTEPWVFVSIERQNQLYVYKLNADTVLARAPAFIKATLADPRP